MLRGLIIPTAVFLLAGMGAAPAAPAVAATSVPHEPVPGAARLLPSGPRGMLFDKFPTWRPTPGGRRS